MEIIDEIRPRREERGSLRKLIAALGAVCFVVILLIAAVWPTKAHAEDIPLHVLEKDGVEIRLMNTPCVDPISLGVVKAAYHSRLKAVQSVWPERDGSRKAYAGCWLELTITESAEPAFLVVFEDAQHGVIPKSEFKKVKGQSGA